MFNRKESLERKFRAVVAGVTALTGTGALVYLLNREASPVAAEPPKPAETQADFRCYDFDRGRNVFEKGPLVFLSASDEWRISWDRCNERYPNVLIEQFCCREDPECVAHLRPWDNPDIPAEWNVPCSNFGATCREGRCVREEGLTPIPTEPELK